jgi:hypothetical protein
VLAQLPDNLSLRLSAGGELSRLLLLARLSRDFLAASAPPTFMRDFGHLGFLTV